MSLRKAIFSSLLLLGIGGIAANCQAGDFEKFVKPALTQNCQRCHGDKEANAEVNFQQIRTEEQLLSNPKLIHRAIKALDANDMPPEGEPPLEPKTRARLLATLKTLLKQATAREIIGPNPIRRLNRFQYNNSVRDLFQLNRDVFALPEKLMTRHDNYLFKHTGKMPDKVQVACHSLDPKPGLKGVKAFPKDLRAAHGFDNQADQLTLSPLLLDAFLRLSVSILESPDFNQENVGIWNQFFQEPMKGVDQRTEIQRRLARFLRLAFRGPVAQETLNRYTAYTISKIDHGLSFPESMKKVASAVLCSPMFLYRSSAADDKSGQYDLASKLSFFLWSSGPDWELLQLAERGELNQAKVLNSTIERMLADPKIERFLDTFPTQWMQLENVLAATPDPAKNKYFRLDKNNPASLQMVLEPLLLFDAVFLENRPIRELISPKFVFQSEFLKTWYTTDLKPLPIEMAKLVEENQKHDQQRKQLDQKIATAQAERDAMEKTVREKLLAARKGDLTQRKPVDLKPYAAWEFNGDLKGSLNSLDLKAHGKITFKEGKVVLNRAYLQSPNLPISLRAKTLEVWCQPHNLNQRGGGVMGIQGPGDFFDTIVLGERQPRHWISGSNGFSRTLDFPQSTPETETNQMLHLVMVYAEDGTTSLYRNGQPYGKPFRKGQATFPKDQTSVLFGLRHLPAGGNKYLSVSLDKARLYDRALTAEEIAASFRGDNVSISTKELLAAFSLEQKTKHTALTNSLGQLREARKQIPAFRDPGKAKQEAQQWFEDDLKRKLQSRVFERSVATDPRYGGVITNAAVMSMTSGPKRTHPVARGVWMIEVLFNDPPPPPPNDVPPLNEEANSKDLTIRETFAAHRENPSCAGCHVKLDPLGFALENFDLTGRWRDNYENGRKVDSSGTLLRKYEFDGIVRFKESLVKEDQRFAKALTEHLLRFALSRELTPADAIAVEDIVHQAKLENYRFRSLIKEVMRSERFRQTPNPLPKQ